MFKRLLLLLLSLLITVPIVAQDTETPQAAVNGALDAVEAIVGERSGNFTFQFLDANNDSSLGCALIEGEELPFNQTVVQVEVIYPDASYTVLTSANGQTVILCDSQFSEEVLDAQLSDDPCMAMPVSAVPAYVAPNLTLDGVFTANEATRIYGQSADGGWYQVASDTSLGWIEATSVTLSGECADVLTTAIVNPVAPVVCFINTQSSFSNVRSQPSVDAPLVARIYENEVYQVTNRNTAGDWFYVQPIGWVSSTVAFTTGDCINIEVNDNAVGIGFVDSSDENSVEAIDAAAILQEFACPLDFAGYLIPRIETGEANVQVEAGAVPNTLRDFPSVDDDEAPRLGVIQPNRVIDRVIAGPACNQGFVWWLVEIDGVIGWTAESNESSNDYYLVPVGEDGNVSEAPDVDNQPVVVDADSNEITVGENAVEEIIYNADNSKLFAETSQQGFGDGEVGVVIVYDATNNTSIARIEEPTGIHDIDYAADTDDILIAAGDGTLTLYNTQSLEQSGQLVGVYSSEADFVNAELLPDASAVILGYCSDSDCTEVRVQINDVATGEELNRATLSTSAIIAIAVSEDGSTLAVLTPDGVSFHTVDTLDEISSWENTDAFSLVDVVINEDGTSALFAGCNNTDCSQGRIGLVNVADGALLGIVPSHDDLADNITYNADQSRFVTTADVELDGQVIERDTATGEATQGFDVIGTTVTDVAYLANGTQIAIATADGRILLFDLEQ